MSKSFVLHGALVASILSLAACGGGSSGASTSVSSSSGASSTSSTSTAAAQASALMHLSAGSYQVAPSATSATITVTRSGTTTGAASVSYTTVNGSAVAGSDYVGTSGTLQWADGDTAAKTFSVALKTRGKAFSVALTSVAGASLGSPASATVQTASTSSSSSSSSSGGSSSSSSGGTTLSSKQKLANYLSSLTNKSGKHLLLGQHSDYWTSAPMANITAITNVTGKYPSILGTTLDLGNSPEDGVTTSNQWLSQGGIVMLSWWAGNPHTGVNSGDADNTAGNFNDVLTPGTQAYQNFYATLDILAGQLKQINGPVMFRPFLELNGNWFWWGGHDTASFIKLWKATHDYLVNTKGVTNLLWVYCINAGLGNYTSYYPGSDYVDVVAMDAYPIRSNDSEMVDPLSTLNKPIIYAEADQGPEQVQGILPYVDTVDDNVMVTTVLNNFPNVVGIVTWCNTTSLEKQLNITEAMNNSQVITRSDLPTTLY